MKLTFSPASPFARKVRIAAIETGLIDKIELIPATVAPGQPNEEYSKITPLKKLPVLILVCALGEPDRDDPALELGFWGSILPAAWSLMLALRARGLGTTWTTLLARERKALARLLEIPEGVTQTVLLPVAWTKDAKLRPARRKTAAEVAYWNAWGRSRQ